MPYDNWNATHEELQAQAWYSRNELMSFIKQYARRDLSIIQTRTEMIEFVNDLCIDAPFSEQRQFTAGKYFVTGRNLDHWLDVIAAVNDQRDRNETTRALAGTSDGNARARNDSVRSCKQQMSALRAFLCARDNWVDRAKFEQETGLNWVP